MLLLIALQNLQNTQTTRALEEVMQLQHLASDSFNMADGVHGDIAFPSPQRCVEELAITEQLQVSPLDRGTLVAALQCMTPLLTRLDQAASMYSTGVLELSRASVECLNKKRRG